MTENEAIKHLKLCKKSRMFIPNNDVLKVAIQALEEVQQYRTIGTVEECRVAVERMKPKKPIPLDKWGEYHECPVCGKYAENNYGCKYLYCPNCGCKYDWSE